MSATADSTCGGSGGVRFVSWPLALLVLLLAGASGCNIPPGLRGSWVQYGYPNNSRVLITATEVQGKGRCAVGDTSTGKYVMYRLHSSDEGNFICYTCVVITRRTDNILQYKETSEENMRCDPDASHSLSKTLTPSMVESICSGVGPDDVLHTLVREASQPVACPFHGSFSVEHSRHGGRLCRSSPQSTIDQCASDTQQTWLLWRCPDIIDSEGLDQDLHCLGSWQDGDSWFYVKSRGDYRCIRYRSLQSGQMQLYVSDDSSCTSISSDRTSPWVLKLTSSSKVSSNRRSQPRCSFPSWFASTSWRDVMGAMNVELGNQRSMHLSLPAQALVASRATYHGQTRNVTVSRTTCISAGTRSAEPQPTEDYVVSVMEECMSRYQCLRFKRLADNVVHLKKGKPVSHPDGACSASAAPSDGSAGDQLLVASAVPRSCPFVGQYRMLNGELSRAQRCTASATTFRVGCSSPTSFDVVAACQNTEEQHYECLASWATPEAKYVIIGQPSAPLKRAASIVACYSYTIGRSGDIRLKWDQVCGELSLHKTVDRSSFPVELSLRPLSHSGSCSQAELEYRKPAAPSTHSAPNGAASSGHCKLLLALVAIAVLCTGRSFSC